MNPIKAPFPYAGGKSAIASEVWRRFGNPPNYVEPCAGSLAMLLARPGGPGKIETVNDKDGLLANFWRAVSFDPDAVAAAADWPVNENDLHARHAWLVARRASLSARLEGDPEFYDARAAGWWLWGACNWIGLSWCAGKGAWRAVDGELVKSDRHRENTPGIPRQIPHLATRGMGINRQVGRSGSVEQHNLYTYMRLLQARLRHVRVCCGEWDRVLGKSVTTRHGVTAVFLDPPYEDSEYTWSYAAGGGVAQAARAWAIANGDNPQLRIAYCGYDLGEPWPKGWTTFRWKTRGGYGNQSDGQGRRNAGRETVWFSPGCLSETPLESQLRAYTEG